MQKISMHKKSKSTSDANSIINSIAKKRQIPLNQYQKNPTKEFSTKEKNETSNSNLNTNTNNNITSTSALKKLSLPIIQSQKIKEEITINKSHVSIEVKNYKKIRSENMTINNSHLPISNKNFDLKKIVEREKFNEIQKFHFLENFFENKQNYFDEERIFYNDPLRNLDYELIKNRNRKSESLLRNERLVQEREMYSCDQSPKYSFRKCDKMNLYEYNRKVKYNVLEKEVENFRRSKEIELLREKGYNNNNNNNSNGNYNSYNRNDYNYNYNYDNDVSNSNFINTTNFLRDNINTVEVNNDANLNPIVKGKLDNANLNNNQMKEYEIKLTDNNQNDRVNTNNNNIMLSRRKDQFTNKNINTNNSNQKNNNNKQNISSSKFHKPSLDNTNTNINISGFDMDIPFFEETENNNIINNNNNNKIKNSTKSNFNNINKKNFENSLAKEDNKNFLITTSQQFFDEEKIQNLNDSGILINQNYENVYFKSMQYISEKEGLLNPNPECSKNGLNLIDIEPKMKTKNEVEKIKKGIKDIFKRRFDFSDEYLNDIHRRLQDKKIQVDPDYQNAKNGYEQYKQQRIIDHKDHDIALKLRLSGRNPIMQVNNSVSFPNIVNDPMLLASIYNVNMYNLEYTSRNKKLK